MSTLALWPSAGEELGADSVAGEHTVAQISDLLGVRRTTLYGHLNKPAAEHPTLATP